MYYVYITNLSSAIVWNGYRILITQSWRTEEQPWDVTEAQWVSDLNKCVYLFSYTCEGQMSLLI